MFEIKLKSGFTGERYGLTFIDGKAITDDGFLAGRLEAKGISVSVLTPEKPESIPERSEDIPENEPAGIGSVPDEEEPVKAKRGKEK